MRKRLLQSLVGSALVLLVLFANQHTKVYAQTITTFEVTAVLQGYWDGVDHRPAAVAVELRSGVDLTTSVSEAITTGLLGTDAKVTVTFEDLPSGDYWLVIRHGSHMPVAATNQITVTAGQTHSYDFSNANDKAFPGFDPITPVIVEFLNTGVFQIRTGDLDGDQTVSANDFIFYFSPNFGESNAGEVPDID